MDDGVQDYNDTVLFGTGYTVTEDVIPEGWEFVSVDCSASTGVTPTINDAQVTFDIDADTDVLDCTYRNQSRGSIVVEKVTTERTGTFDFSSNSLGGGTPQTPHTFSLTTTAAGQAGKDSETFSDLAPGTYDAEEDVPAGWNLHSATCDDGSDPASIGLAAGEAVICTFTDSPQNGAILITKTRKHAADGPGDHPHANIPFTVTGGSLPPAGTTVTTDDNGEACVDGLLLSSFDGVGNYTVTEGAHPGYADQDPITGVVVDNEAACDDPYGGEEVSFSNTPLTNVTVSVDSQVDGGTASTMQCTDSEGNVSNGSTGANGDGSLPVNDLEPTAPGVTLTCEVTIDP
jgi:hypothetical protein